MFNVITAAANGGNACTANDKDVKYQNCDAAACPVDCVGSWSAWSACDATACGTSGKETSTLNVITAAANGGNACTANDMDVKYQNCNAAACPVDCVGSWSAWSACDASACGTSGKETPPSR
jgi:hypothetical protein